MKLIVEVAMEIALTPELLNTIAEKWSPSAARESAMTTSVGGIGPLLRERIIAEAENEQERSGLSLLSDKVWVQRWQIWGQLYLEKKPSLKYIQSVLRKESWQITVAMNDGSPVEATVWRAPYGKAVVYFLHCPGITSVVYPGIEDAPPGVKDKIAWY